MTRGLRTSPLNVIVNYGRMEGWQVALLLANWSSNEKIANGLQRYRTSLRISLLISVLYGCLRRRHSAEWYVCPLHCVLKSAAACGSRKQQLLCAHPTTWGCIDFSVRENPWLEVSCDPNAISVRTSVYVVVLYTFATQLPLISSPLGSLKTT